MRTRLVPALLLLALSSSPALPQEPGDEADGDAAVAWATLRVDPGHATTLHLMGRTRDAAVAAALEKIAGRAPQATEYGEWTQWTIELPAPAWRGLVLRQDLRLDPLLEAIAAAGAPSLSLLIQHPPAGFATLTGARALPAQRGTLAATLSTGAPAAPLSLELGWRSSDVWRSATILLLALLLPILGGLAIWRRSLARDKTPESWFVRVQAMQVVTLAGWVLWMIVLDGARLSALVSFVFGGATWMPVVTGPLLMLGFLPAAFALVAISRRIARRLRGFDPLPRRAGFVGSLPALALLIPLLVGALAFNTGNLRLGVFAVLAFLGLSLLLPRARGPLGSSPQALSSGALRDRLFDLAHRAGVKLRDLYVVPMRRERMANAFAVHGGTVIVTDELLDRMSRRELDAVLAHEITHLEHQHPIKTLLAALAVYAVVSGACLALKMPYGFAAAFVAAWLAYRFVARRFEFAADAGAAALTADPEAVISGLGCLSRLNDAPLAWGRAWKWLITHPTTETRGQVVGRRAGLPAARVAELLATGLPSAGHYGERERPGEQERVFSTAWKTTVMSRLSLAMLASAVVAPAAALALARTLGLPLPHWVLLPAGAALALFAMLALQDQLGARVVRGLESGLRRRLGEEGESARFVALSPGDSPRIYEGFLDWDLGLLTIGPEEMRYRGEQLTLRLSPSDIQTIDLGAAAPTWLRAPRVIVRWSGPTGHEAISLRAADSKTVRAIGPSSRALASMLDSWRKDATARAQGDPPPGIGSVTARTLREASAPRDLPLVLVLLGALSAGASFVLGFDSWLGLDLFGAAFLGLMALRWPAMTSREPAQKQAPAQSSERRAA